MQNSHESSKIGRQYSAKIKSKINKMFEDEESKYYSFNSLSNLNLTNDNRLFDEFCLSKEKMKNVEIEREIISIFKNFEAKKLHFTFQTKKEILAEFHPFSAVKTTGGKSFNFGLGERELILTRMNTEHSIEFNRNDLSMSESLSVSHPEINKKTGQEKMDPKEIAMRVESKKREKIILNLDSVEVEIVFLFYFNKNYEKIRLFVASECPLKIMSEQFFKLFNTGGIKFDKNIIRKQLNSTNFEWKKIKSDISNEMTKEDFQFLEVEEENLLDEDILTEKLMSWSSKKSFIMSEKIFVIVF